MRGEFTAVFEKRGKYWIGYTEELPGANSQGKSLAEARENLKEAIELVLAANRELLESEGEEAEEVLKEQITVSL